MRRLDPGSQRYVPGRLKGEVHVSTKQARGYKEIGMILRRRKNIGKVPN